MTPEYTSSGAGNADGPKRGRQVLPLSEKVKHPQLNKKKISYAEIAKISKTKSSVCEIMGKLNLG